MSDHRPIDDDQRYDLVARAHAAETRNRPTTLVALGALVLIAAGAIFALSSLRLTAAEREVRSQERRVAQLIDLAAEYRALSEKAETDDDGCLDPVPNLLSRLEIFARNANIDPPNPPNATARPLGANSNLQRLRYPYQVRDRSIEEILEWIRLSMEGVPCLEIDSLEVTPEERQQRWLVKVTFSRLERIP